jgi:hypothetical protein
LLEELWNYWMSHHSVAGVSVSTAFRGVERAGCGMLGVWCVGMLLGPEATPARVLVLLGEMLRGLF